MSATTYDNLRKAMLLAGFQKVEEEINRSRGIETTDYFFKEKDLELLEKWDYIYEYLPQLFSMIDQEGDMKWNIEYLHLFQDIMEDVHFESTDEVTEVYQMHLGLLSAAVERYGIEPFEEIIDEFERSFNQAGLYVMPLIECCHFMYVDVEDADEALVKKIQEYATYLRFTYLIQIDVAYITSDEVMEMAGSLPRLAKEYDMFCEKLTKICMSLKGDVAV